MQAAMATNPKAESAENGKKGFASWSRSKALWVMRMGNCCNGLCLATFAVIVFLLPTGSLVPNFQTITVSGYLAFLGLMMCCVELNIQAIQQVVRRRLGFLFSFIGRAVFIFFAGSMALALAMACDGSSAGSCTDLELFTIVGGVTCLNAVFNFVVILCNPAFREESGVLDDPWAPSARGSTAAGLGDPEAGRGSLKPNATAEETMVAFLRAHPQLAVKALQSSVVVAQQLHDTGSQRAAPAAAPAGAASAPPRTASRPVLSVINPFRRSPKPGTGTSGAVAADLPELAATSNKRSSRKGGESAAAHNPFHAAPSAGAVVASPAVHDVLREDSSANNIFAISGSLDARSYGDQRPSEVPAPSAAPAAPAAAAAHTSSQPPAAGPADFANPFR